MATSFGTSLTQGKQGIRRSVKGPREPERNKVLKAQGERRLPKRTTDVKARDSVAKIDNGLSRRRLLKLKGSRGPKIYRQFQRGETGRRLKVRDLEYPRRM